MNRLLSGQATVELVIFELTDIFFAGGKCVSFPPVELVIFELTDIFDAVGSLLC